MQILQADQGRLLALLQDGPAQDNTGLTELNMESIEFRGDTLDMVQTFKILREVDNVDKNPWFTVRAEEGGHGKRATLGGLNIVGKRSRLEICRNFFSQRVVDKWNGLSLETRQAKSIGEFKWRLKNEYRN